MKQGSDNRQISHKVNNNDTIINSSTLIQSVSLNIFKQQPFNPSPNPSSNLNPTSTTAQSIQTLHRPNGAVYKGQTLNSLPHGHGIMLYKNGQRYEGQFSKGNKHGKGKYYYIKGQLYIGDWKNNVKHGVGQYFYQNGTRYSGEFQNNMKHGDGRLDEENGSYYQGNFNMNNKDKTGFYYDTIKNKKYMMTYDNGKLIVQRQIIDVPLQQNKQQSQIQQKIRLILGDSNQDRRLSAVVSQAFDITNSDGHIHPKINYYNFHSDFHQSFLSIKNYQLKDQLQQKKFIAQNYFQKELLEKRSTYLLYKFIQIVNEWSIIQVSSWLNQIGFGDCIEDFKENMIEGDSLLFLNNQDLKQLGISALGDRRIFQREIEFLKLIFKSQCLGDTISKLKNKKLTFDVIQNIQQAQIKQENKAKRQKQKDDINTNQLENQSQSSSTSSDSQKQLQKKKIKKQTKPRNMQYKIQNYMAKKGIKLTFLIPKQQIQIIQPIGKGGYGQVYLGRWLGQQVAVKKYLKKQGFRNRHIGHFIQQVQVINKLLHPSIILYMGMCIDDNQYAMVTQFLSGGSLFDYLHKKQQNLSQQQIINIMKDVSLGMSYLHGKNLLHCDLKSSNVLIDQNWNVKLCDFGLSRINSTKNNKKKNIRVGTPHWMAPEILKGQKYQCYSDVYSFGILVWEMLTCKIPYKDLSTAQIIGLVGNNQNHHISIPTYDNQHILRIFLACTQRDPHKRPTFKAIVAELEIAEEKYYKK